MPTRSRDRTVGSSNRLLGWMGTVLLLGILPIKLARFDDHGASSFAIGVAPSVLGSAGLLFLFLSSTGRLARLSLLRLTLLVTALSLALELLQLLPRPGLLARAHYTFDVYDVAATILGVAMAYAVSAWFLRPLPGAAEMGTSDPRRRSPGIVTPAGRRNSRHE